MRCASGLCLFSMACPQVTAVYAAAAALARGCTGAAPHPQHVRKASKAAPANKVTSSRRAEAAVDAGGAGCWLQT